MCYFIQRIVMRYAYYKTDIGQIKIGYDKGIILSLDFSGISPEQVHELNELSESAAFQICEYLSGKRRDFDFPIELRGTPFQLAVWEYLRRIPYGETRTYGQIAAEIGNHSACRAVGMACNRNPVIIAVPCHRVIGANGGLVGYAAGLELKKRLLEIEKIQ